MAQAMMWTTRSLCDELANRKNLNTDYKLAKYLGASQTNVSGWRKGLRWMSDDWGFKLAEELGLDPAYVCLCLAAERSTDANLASKMRAWLVQHASAAVLILSVFAVFSASSPALAFAGAIRGACILC